MSLVKLSLIHSNVIDSDSLEALADEGQNIIDSLEEELEALEDELSDIEEGEEDQRIEELEKEIEEKKSEIELYQKDVNNLNECYKLLSSYSDRAISDSYLDEYIKDKLQEIHSDELNNMTNIFYVNLNWDSIISDSRTDYSEITIDGETYHFE